jgi:hypothetical protein
VAEHPSLEELQAFAAGEAPALQAHINACDTCRANIEFLRQIDAGLAQLPEIAAPPQLWYSIRRQVGRRRTRPLLAASVGLLALGGGAVLISRMATKPAPDPVARIEALYEAAKTNPRQEAAALEALSEETHAALEKKPDNASLHDLAYVLDRKRAELAASGVAVDSAAVDSLRTEAVTSVEAIARRSPRITLFENTARAFAGARLAESPEGLRVVDVLPGSSAARAGLQKDDVLLQADTTSSRTVDSLTEAARDGEVTLLVRRGTAQITIVLQLRS